MFRHCFFGLINNELFLSHAIMYYIIYQEQIGVKQVENIHLFKKINRKIIEKRFPEKCSGNQFL